MKDFYWCSKCGIRLTQYLAGFRHTRRCLPEREVKCIYCKHKGKAKNMRKHYHNKHELWDVPEW